jgi:hypothetical protein
VRAWVDACQAGVLWRQAARDKVLRQVPALWAQGDRNVKWLITVIAVEAIVEILMHSELFAWLRRAKPFTCAWCLSVWVAAGAFGLMVLGLWWMLIPFALARMSNLFHEVFGRIRGY